MTIDSYDWDKLYAKANEFVSKYIPVATVNTNRKSFVNNRPRVDISFRAKGNAKYIKLIDEMQCIRKLKGVQQGIQSGITQGEIIGTLKTYKKFSVSKEETLKNIITDFSLSEEDARNYMEKYW